MKNKCILALGSLVIFAAQTSFAAGNAHDLRCSKFTGPEYGLCVSGISVGCDNPSDRSDKCTSMEATYLKIAEMSKVIEIPDLTKAEPPWSTMDCPCDYKDYIEKNGLPGTLNIFCSDYSITKEDGTQYGYLSIDVDYGEGPEPGSMFSFFPGSAEVTAGKQTCGFDYTSYADMNDAQARGCVRDLQTIAQKFGVKCVEK